MQTVSGYRFPLKNCDHLSVDPGPYKRRRTSHCLNRVWKRSQILDLCLVTNTIVKVKIWPELAGLLRLGIPIIFTQLLQVSQGTIAIIMMGRVGSLELAAVGLGTSFWVFVWLGSMGLLMGLSPTICLLYTSDAADE